VPSGFENEASHSDQAQVINSLDRRSFMESLGPGILFAATSVGVSHLVQSTRAGAAFGLGMLLIIVAAHVFKYSTFRSGSLYARISGKSLLHAYRQQGRGPLMLLGLVIMGTMSITLAGVTIVAAGLAQAVITEALSLPLTSLLVMLLAVAIVWKGNYRYLENTAKYMVVFLSLVTVLTTVLVLPNIEFSNARSWVLESWDLKTILFAVALAGWMPTSLDMSIVQSLWTVEKEKLSPSKGNSAREGSLDFQIGYWGTALLAVCFCLIGAGVMHNSGVSFSNNAANFSSQIIAMYASTLGDWSAPLIASAALAVMFSTVLTVVDAYPRVVNALIATFKQNSEEALALTPEGSRRFYLGTVFLHVMLAYCLIAYWADSFKGLIDMAATLAFVSAPFIAFCNHRAMCSKEIPNQQRLQGNQYGLSILSIVVLLLFSISCLYVMNL